MARCRVVQPHTERLPLSDGDWIVVKRRLNAGEQRAMFARMYLAGIDGTLRVNPLQQGIAKIVAYLLDWSLIAPDGKVIPIAEVSPDGVVAAVDAQDPETVAEIKAAIEAHEQRMTAEREQEKNAQDGATASPAISPSPSAPAGALSGSANSTSMTTTS